MDKIKSQENVCLFSVCSIGKISFSISVMKKLPREFYLRDDTLLVARALLGKTLVVPAETGERVSGKIVEAEAYLGAIDKAAHSYGNRRTKRTETMFSIGGTVYIFFIYGMYFQFNVVVGAVDSPHAILIRAVEPIEGIEIMRDRRRLKSKRSDLKIPDKNLTSGPGKLCIALGIDKTFNNEDLLGEKVWIEEGAKIPDEQVAFGKRIGIDYAQEYAEKPWRFWVKDNPFVSRA
jgi:DNA-3-methyladenine glycosylase